MKRTKGIHRLSGQSDDACHREAVPALQPMGKENPQSSPLAAEVFAANGGAAANTLETVVEEIRYRLERIEKALVGKSGEAGVVPSSTREWFNTKEAAQALGLAVWTTRNHLRLGRIVGVRASTKRGEDREWRVSRTEIIHILEHGLRPPQYS